MTAFSPDMNINDVIDLQNCFDMNGIRNKDVDSELFYNKI